MIKCSPEYDKQNADVPVKKYSPGYDKQNVDATQCYEMKMHHSGFAEIHTTSNCR